MPDSGLGLSGPHAATPAGKPRARPLGIPFGGTPGTWNAITDVPGVEVGYTTLIRDTSVRTGVTAIHPRGAASPAKGQNSRAKVFRCLSDIWRGAKKQRD